CVAADDAVVESGLDVAVGPVVGWHVAEMGREGVHDYPAFGEHQHLGDLDPADLVTGPEGAVCVAADYAAHVGGLDVLVKWAAEGYVAEIGVDRVVEVPTKTQGEELSELAPGSAGPRPESAVGVA